MSAFFVALAAAVFALMQLAAAGTNTPIIGVFAQPISPTDPKPEGTQYIAASYVKWVESSGGRVVPLPYNATRSFYEIAFSKLNGVVFPGGGSEISQGALEFLKIVEKENSRGDNFVVWATCMGFQWLSMYFARDMNLLKPHHVQNTSLPLDFAPAAVNSRMFAGLSEEEMDIFANPKYSVTMNNHNWGVSLSSFDSSPLKSSFTLLSTNVDDDGKTFVSTMEHKTMPVYGVQWHPEKNNFEYSIDEDGTFHEAINHSKEGVWASRFTSDFFVHQARQNNHVWQDKKELGAALIYNYKPSYTQGSFVQRYYFNW